MRGRASVRIFFFLSNFMLHFYFSPLCVRMSARLCVSSVCERASGRVSRSVRLVSSPPRCRSAMLIFSVCVFGFAAVPPTPQPTDDVDIYFETPADDKEHSRFQRAKEQLEIRHRNRMERVSY